MDEQAAGAPDAQKPSHAPAMRPTASIFCRPAPMTHITTTLWYNSFASCRIWILDVQSMRLWGVMSEDAKSSHGSHGQSFVDHARRGELNRRFLFLTLSTTLNDHQQEQSLEVSRLTRTSIAAVYGRCIVLRVKLSGREANKRGTCAPC